MSIWDILPEDLQLKILEEKQKINIKYDFFRHIEKFFFYRKQNDPERLRQEAEDKRVDDYYNSYEYFKEKQNVYDEYDDEKEDNYEGYDAGIECGWESDTEYEEESDTE